MPDSANNPTDVVTRLLAGRRIAVVGASDDPTRVSHMITLYLRDAGYDVLPVNPNAAVIGGLPCYKSLADVSGPIDLVNVFRRAEFCPDVTRAAVAAGAAGVWLQSGIRSPESAAIAAAAGIDFVQDRCIMVEHRRR